MKQSPGKCLIGTSNIIVPGNKSSYPSAYSGKSRLNYYSSFFNSLEVNSSFYKVPMPATFQKWAKDVPDNFQFTVKLWKEITHSKQLTAEMSLLDHFLNSADHLETKRGCLLIQFPAKISVEYYNHIEAILQRISKREKKWRIAVEFRDVGWYIGETFEMINEFNASIVLHDILKGKNTEERNNAPFTFIRFHGPAGDYKGSYSDNQLKDHAVKIKEWLLKGKDVYTYFNNSIGDAFENARSLQKMLV